MKKLSNHRRKLRHIIGRAYIEGIRTAPSVPPPLPKGGKIQMQIDLNQIFCWQKSQKWIHFCFLLHKKELLN